MKVMDIVIWYEIVDSEPVSGNFKATNYLTNIKIDFHKLFKAFMRSVYFY